MWFVPLSTEAVTEGSALCSMVTVAAIVPSVVPGVELITCPIGGVTFVSPGSMTGSRSSRPVRSWPSPPLTKSGPWMALSWSSSGANTWVSPPSTRLFSCARTRTVIAWFHCCRSFWLTFKPLFEIPAPVPSALNETRTLGYQLTPSSETSSCCWKETMPPVSDVRVG